MWGLRVISRPSDFGTSAWVTHAFVPTHPPGGETKFVYYVSEHFGDTIPWNVVRARASGSRRSGDTVLVDSDSPSLMALACIVCCRGWCGFRRGWEDSHFSRGKECSLVTLVCLVFPPTANSDTPMQDVNRWRQVNYDFFHSDMKNVCVSRCGAFCVCHSAGLTELCKFCIRVSMVRTSLSLNVGTLNESYICNKAFRQSTSVFLSCPSVRLRSQNAR